jgi:hypothetical protein
MECKGRCSAKLMRSGEIGVKLRASDGAAPGEGREPKEAAYDTESNTFRSQTLSG